MSLSLTSAAALRAAADKLTPLIYPKQQTSKNLTAERIATKHAAADRAFCADPLAKSPCSSAARRSVLCFPLPPCFSFSERPLWHGSSRKSTAEKLPRKTFIVLIRNSSCMELFFVLRSLFRAYIGTNFSFLPLTCANLNFREPHFQPSRAPLPLARKRQNHSRRQFK